MDFFSRKNLGSLCFQILARKWFKILYVCVIHKQSLCLECLTGIYNNVLRFFCVFALCFLIILNQSQFLHKIWFICRHHTCQLNNLKKPTCPVSGLNYLSSNYRSVIWNYFLLLLFELFVYTHFFWVVFLFL